MKRDKKSENLEKHKLRIENLLKRLEGKYSKSQKDEILKYIRQAELYKDENKYKNARDEYLNTFYVLLEVIRINLEELCAEKNVEVPNFYEKYKGSLRLFYLIGVLFFFYIIIFNIFQSLLFFILLISFMGIGFFVIFRVIKEQNNFFKKLDINLKM